MEPPPASYSNSSTAPSQNMIILKVPWCSALSRKEISLLLPAFLCPPTTTAAPVVESELHNTHQGLGHGSDRQRAEVMSAGYMKLGLLNFADNLKLPLTPSALDSRAVIPLPGRIGPFLGSFNTSLFSF